MLRRFVIMTALIMLAAPKLLFSCGQTYAGPPFITLSPSLDTVRVSGFTTFGSGAGGDSCACALAAGGAVTGVTSVSFVVGGTNTPIANFGAFSPAVSASNAFQAFVPALGGTSWSGFRTVTTGAVTGGVNADLVFTVNSTGGAVAVINSLKSANLVGVGKIVNGSLDPLHRSAEQAILTPTVTSLTNYGFIILTLLLVGTGFWLFRKRLAMGKGGLA
jgi:hypothetical protein